MTTYDNNNQSDQSDQDQALCQSVAKGEQSPLALAGKLNALDPGFRENPLPYLSAISEQGSGTLLQEGIMLSLARASDIAETLRDTKLWVDPHKSKPDSPSRILVANQSEDRQLSILLLDNPDHKRLRSILVRDFTPKALEKWRTVIKETAHDLLDSIQKSTSHNESWDLIQDYAGPLPTIVIGKMLGLEERDFGWFKVASDAVSMAFFNPACTDEEREQGRYWDTKLNEHFTEMLAVKRRNPGDDLISSMVAAADQEQQISDKEILTQCNLLLVAGNITTTDLIGNGLHCLLQDRKQWQLLCENPQLAANTVEEMLRLTPPVMNTARIADRPRQIAGCPMDTGETINLMLAAGNLDPRTNPDPHTLNIERKNITHFSFGGGAHFCLGAHLARMEAQEALLALTNRYPQLQLVPPIDTGASKRSMPGFSGFLSIPVHNKPIPT
ncbi:MAG: cytochrome P450 [Gammaproteobacteria bacterium]